MVTWQHAHAHKLSCMEHPNKVRFMYLNWSGIKQLAKRPLKQKNLVKTIQEKDLGWSICTDSPWMSIGCHVDVVKWRPIQHAASRPEFGYQWSSSGDSEQFVFCVQGCLKHYAKVFSMFGTNRSHHFLSNNLTISIWLQPRL